MRQEWVSVLDDVTRHDHRAADGQKVAPEAGFEVGGHACAYPGDHRLPAGQRINCRCTVLYVEPGEDVDMSNRGFRGDRATSDEVAARSSRGIIRARDGGR